MAAKIPVKVRQMCEDDLALICRSWVDSYADSRLARTMKPTVYRDRQLRLVRAILARPTTHAIVATPPDDDLVILAWAVLEAPDVVHYVFTKRQFRRFGLAGELLKALDGTFKHSHKTDDGDKLGRSFRRPTYDFYAAFKGAL